MWCAWQSLRALLADPEDTEKAIDLTYAIWRNDFERSVGAAGIDDMNVVRDLGRAVEGRRDGGFGIEGQDDDGNAHRTNISRTSMVAEGGRQV